MEIEQIIIELREARKELSIKDLAQILGQIMDDNELEVLIKEIKNISINI
jgi:uncharacterized protein (UPF0128 family)